jgi:putative ABC transport system permease protein
MKYLPLLWAGLWRRPLRTVLTLISVANAFLLFGLLQGFSTGVAGATSQIHADVLFTFSRVSQIEPLPLGIRQEIERVPGVISASPVLVFQSTYQTPNQVVRAFAVDVPEFLKTYPGVTPGADALTAMQTHRNGALVSDTLARRYGWKVGDVIPLRSMLWANRSGSSTWPVQVAGIYQAAANTLPANAILLNFAYADEGRTFSRGTTSVFAVRVKDADQAALVASQIDYLSANSPHETRTATEQQLAQDSLKQIGDVSLIVQAVVGAMFFAILFSVGVIMMQGLRERTSEFGVLKALGFRDSGLLTLVLSETVVFCLIAAGVGLSLAVAAFPAIETLTGFQAQAGSVLAFGLIVALVLALVTGLPPAIKAMRLQIADALSGR